MKICKQTTCRHGMWPVWHLLLTCLVLYRKNTDDNETVSCFSVHQYITRLNNVDFWITILFTVMNKRKAQSKCNRSQIHLYNAVLAQFWCLLNNITTTFKSERIPETESSKLPVNFRPFLLINLLSGLPRFKMLKLKFWFIGVCIGL